MAKFGNPILLGILFCWGLSVASCDIKTPNLNASLIDQVGVKILKACYADYKTIVIDGDSDESLIQSLSFMQSITVITHNDSSKTNIAVEHRSKMHLFLITTDSVEQLQKKLVTFKYSPWWNIMADFVILDRSNGGCENAREILQACWTMNIVTAFFLCHINSEHKLMIYTSNPYTNRAPYEWKEVKNNVKQYDRWTLYNQQYHEGSICKSWSFDRTKFLDGYNIRIVVSKPRSDKWIPQRIYDPRLSNWKPNKDYNDSVLDMIPKLDGRVGKALRLALNATIVINFDTLKYYTDKPEGFFKRLQNASSDLAVCISSYPIIYNFTPMYPIMYSGVAIVTQHRGYYSIHEKMMNYYGIAILLATLLILSITFVAVIIVTKKAKIALAAFEVIRLLVNASLRTRMDTFPVRIFFSGIFLYFLIIQTTLQGNLLSFLTKKELRRNVESVKDLRDPRYSTVYVILSGKRLIEDPILEKKLVIPAHPFCVPQVLQDPSVACIADSGVLIKAAVEYNLHLAKHFVGPNAFVYPVRDDWPLTKRVNEVFIRLAQSGISVMWGVDMVAQELIKEKILSAKSVVETRPITLEKLAFAFQLLGFGLICATICFAFELLIGKKRHKEERKAKI